MCVKNKEQEKKTKRKERNWKCLSNEEKRNQERNKEENAERSRMKMKEKKNE